MTGRGVDSVLAALDEAVRHARESGHPQLAIFEALRAACRAGIPLQEMVPAYRLDQCRARLADREAELLDALGPCRVSGCRLHAAHRGPCDLTGATP